MKLSRGVPMHQVPQNVSELGVVHGNQGGFTEAQVCSIGDRGAEIVSYRVQRVFVKNLR